MSALHSSVDGERLAEAWHLFGLWVSLASLVMAAGGIGWHLWAYGEHEKHKKQLESEP